MPSLLKGIKEVLDMQDIFILEQFAVDDYLHDLRVVEGCVLNIQVEV